jgi:hypothetical protein
MKFQTLSLWLLQAAWMTTDAFVSRRPRTLSVLQMAGEGGDKEWSKALAESTAAVPGVFEKEMKLKGLLGKNNGNDANPKLTANSNLLAWLEKEGEVYLSEESSWGEAPHPMAISTDTKDEITNESSGRGLLARRDVSDGDMLFRIPIKLCLTKASARKALSKKALPKDINEYLAIACQLIHEKFVMGDQSEWQPYIAILPEVGEVNPTFAWSDDDVSFLAGSPVIAATKSLQAKLQREFDALLGGQGGLINTYPDLFPEEVGTFVSFGCDYCLFLLLIPFSRKKLNSSRCVYRYSTLRMNTGFGHLLCSFLVRFVYGVSRRVKP